MAREGSGVQGVPSRPLDFQPQVVQLDREVAVVHTPRRHEVFGIER
jgi:hypothetical protein